MKTFPTTAKMLRSVKDSEETCFHADSRGRPLDTSDMKNLVTLK